MIEKLIKIYQKRKGYFKERGWGERKVIDKIDTFTIHVRAQVIGITEEKKILQKAT